MTIRERFGTLSGIRVAYLGDGNNVCHSLMRIAGRLGMELVAATPPGYEPRADVTRSSAEDAAESGGSVTVMHDPAEAARDAHVLYTDVWTSMGQDDDRERRVRELAPYRIDAAMLALAHPDGIVLHCLPAHVGEEITEEVLYGPRSLVWEQAENRLHTQKAVMALVIR
jgi:ornithine carbamoyltransferase